MQCSVHPTSLYCTYSTVQSGKKNYLLKIFVFEIKLRRLVIEFRANIIINFSIKNFCFSSFPCIVFSLSPVLYCIFVFTCIFLSPVLYFHFSPVFSCPPVLYFLYTSINVWYNFQYLWLHLPAVLSTEFYRVAGIVINYQQNYIFVA